MKVPARCLSHPQAWRPADWGAERGYRLPPSVTAVKPLTVALNPHRKEVQPVKAVNLVTDEERELRFSTTNSASSYGIPVLVDADTGEAIDAFSFACYKVLEATEDEIQQLHQFGYM